MKIDRFILAAGISFAMAFTFSCTESPSSPSDEGSSSSVGSEVISSSSKGNGAGGNPSSSSRETSSSSSGIVSVEGKACIYSAEEFGFSGLFACAEALDPQVRVAECEEEDGTYIDACPSGEKATCVDEEQVGEILKLYAQDWTCGDLLLKNADGSEDNVAKGGACGPLTPPYDDRLMCFEFPEHPTKAIKLICTGLGTSFVEQCPNAVLACYDPEDELIIHLYDEEMSLYTCADFDMEEVYYEH